MSKMVAILAGGLATRLRPITETIPKAMVRVAGKPFIQHQIELLKRNGLKRFVICVGYLGEQIEEFLGNGSEFEVSVQYSYDGPELLGTGGALRKAAGLLDDTFFVLYGDSYLDIDYQAVGNYFHGHSAQGLMTVYHNAGKWDKSNVVFAGGLVAKYDKYSPTLDMEYIDYGLGILRKEVLKAIQANEVYDLANLYSALAERKQLLGYEVNQRFYEIGSHKGLGELTNYLTRGGG